MTACIYRKESYFLIRERTQLTQDFHVDTYPPSESSQETLVIQGTERVQLLHGRDQRLHRRGIHEVEGQQIIDPHGLQWQHGAGQIRALDLWNICRQHFISVGTLRVETIALSRACPACPTSSLFCLCLCTENITSILLTVINIIVITGLMMIPHSTNA